MKFNRCVLVFENRRSVNAVCFSKYLMCDFISWLRMSLMTVWPFTFPSQILSSLWTTSDSWNSLCARPLKDHGFGFNPDRVSFIKQWPISTGVLRQMAYARMGEIQYPGILLFSPIVLKTCILQGLSFSLGPSPGLSSVVAAIINCNI